MIYPNNSLLIERDIFLFGINLKNIAMKRFTEGAVRKP